jgi:hypothetical protein
MSGTTQQVRSQGFVVVECDIPAGMTLSEYKAARAAAPPARPKWRLMPLRRRRG